MVRNSLDEDHKASNAANANSSSTKCKNIQKSASVPADMVQDPDPEYLVAYPNPVAGKVHITMKDIEHYKMIQLHDLAGRSYPVTSIGKRTNNLDIDMAHLSAGYYLIRVVMEDYTRIIPVIKQ